MEQERKSRMGWFSILISGIAALLLFTTDHTFLMILAIISAIGCFWSLGVMHNYATETAKLRNNYSGGFYNIMPHEAQSVPDWITRTNIGFSLVGVVLLIIGIIMIFI